MCAAPVLAQKRNTTEVKREPTQASAYFNYRADDGSIHQVGSCCADADGIIRWIRAGAQGSLQLCTTQLLVCVCCYTFFNC